MTDTGFFAHLRTCATNFSELFDANDPGWDTIMKSGVFNV